MKGRSSWSLVCKPAWCRYRCQNQNTMKPVNWIMSHKTFETANQRVNTPLKREYLNITWVHILHIIYLHQHLPVWEHRQMIIFVCIKEKTRQPSQTSLQHPVQLQRCWWVFGSIQAFYKHGTFHVDVLTLTFCHSWSVYTQTKNEMFAGVEMITLRFLLVYFWGCICEKKNLVSWFPFCVWGHQEKTKVSSFGKQNWKLNYKCSSLKWQWFRCIPVPLWKFQLSKHVPAYMCIYIKT